MPKYPEIKYYLEENLDKTIFQVIAGVSVAIKNHLRNEGWDERHVNTEAEVFKHKCLMEEKNNIFTIIENWVTLV